MKQASKKEIESARSVAKTIAKYYDLKNTRIELLDTNDQVVNYDEPISEELVFIHLLKAEGNGIRSILI